MLIRNEDGTYITGPFDVWYILHDVTTGRYHAAFFEEKPFPGAIPPAKEAQLIRLRSRFHHTEGADDLEGALKHIDEMLLKIPVLAENVWREPMAWDGEIGFVTVVNNWRAADIG